MMSQTTSINHSQSSYLTIQKQSASDVLFDTMTQTSLLRSNTNKKMVSTFLHQEGVKFDEGEIIIFYNATAQAAKSFENEWDSSLKFLKQAITFEIYELEISEFRQSKRIQFMELMYIKMQLIFQNSLQTKGLLLILQQLLNFYTLFMKNINLPKRLAQRPPRRNNRAHNSSRTHHPVKRVKTVTKRIFPSIGKFYIFFNPNNGLYKFGSTYRCLTVRSKEVEYDESHSNLNVVFYIKTKHYRKLETSMKKKYQNQQYLHQVESRLQKKKKVIKTQWFLLNFEDLREAVNAAKLLNQHMENQSFTSVDGANREDGESNKAKSTKWELQLSIEQMWELNKAKKSESQFKGSSEGEFPSRTRYTNQKTMPLKPLKPIKCRHKH